MSLKKSFFFSCSIIFLLMPTVLFLVFSFLFLGLCFEPPSIESSESSESFESSESESLFDIQSSSEPWAAFLLILPWFALLARVLS